MKKSFNILLFILIGNAINAINMPDYCKAFGKKTYSATQPESRTITNVGFSFKNKSTVPYTIEVTNQSIANYANKNKRVATVKPGQKPYNLKLDVSKSTTLKLIDPSGSERFYTFKPNKTIYVTWQGVLRPQTGPNNGQYKVTDDCFLKANNVVDCPDPINKSKECDWTETYTPNLKRYQTQHN